MNTLVIDASIAVKWVIEEQGTPEALALRHRAKLIAPDLLVAECANVFWKKFTRNELTRDEAILAAKLLQGADVELLPTLSLLESATDLAIELNHAACDCVYLALAIEKDCHFVTADERFMRTVKQSRHRALRSRSIGLREAVEHYSRL